VHQDVPDERTEEHIMWKPVAVAGVAAVLIGGAGTAAVAASSTRTPAAAAPSSAGAPAATPRTAGKAGRLDADRLRRAVRATWVTENATTKAFTTHDAIRGQVTAVSATAISVQAADKVTQTYVVGPEVKVRVRATRATASIAEVKPGDRVLVVGTGETTLTASRVLDLTK
jgi:hypothetical protein